MGLHNAYLPLRLLAGKRHKHDRTCVYFCKSRIDRIQCITKNNNPCQWNEYSKLKVECDVHEKFSRSIVWVS